MKDFFRRNGILLIVAAVLLALVTVVLSAALGGRANPISALLGWISTPVRNGVSALADWSQERYDDRFARQQMKEENERLKSRVAELEAQQREAAAAIQEKERLRSLNGLRPTDKKFDLESARVTARTTSNWESTLTISKGTSTGVEPGDCVVDAYWNLVGIVAEVGPNYAIVRTVVDAETELGGLISRTDESAILEGDFSLMARGMLKLTYLPEEGQFLVGDLALTSGMGGIYPPGLPVGHIENLYTEASGMGRCAAIRPETDLDHLKQVFVIKDFEIIE